MDLASGTIRTWTNTATAATPTRVLSVRPESISWTPDGRTLIVGYSWQHAPNGDAAGLAVLGLDTSSAGGSLQASSRLLLSRDWRCCRDTCAVQVLAGPSSDYLTVLEMQNLGPSTSGARVVRLPLTSGAPEQLLYGTVFHGYGVTGLGIAEDSSAQHVIFSGSSPNDPKTAEFGWISGGKLIRFRPPGLPLGGLLAW